MTEEDRTNAEAARRSADRLALALEEAGFDVGQDFPALHDAIGRGGKAVVRIGDVSPSIASRLAVALVARAQRPTPTEEDFNR
jgi:hypothetical protein